MSRCEGLHRLHRLHTACCHHERCCEKRSAGLRSTQTLITCVYPPCEGTAFPLADTPDQLVTEPRKGSALLFYNVLPDGNADVNSLHMGLPVQAGEKWVANLWVGVRARRCRTGNAQPRSEPRPHENVRDWCCMCGCVVSCESDVTACAAGALSKGAASKKSARDFSNNHPKRRSHRRDS